MRTKALKITCWVVGLIKHSEADRQQPKLLIYSLVKRLNKDRSCSHVLKLSVCSVLVGGGVFDV